MPSESAVSAAWLVFILVGQWSLLALLVTFFIVKYLSQRSNPFLINFLLTTFLGTIPSTILFYSGAQSLRKSPPDILCFTQAALLDGVPPMFGAAQLALMVDTWSEIRSLNSHTRRITRFKPLKYTLIIIPYVILWGWVFASFITATFSKATHEFKLVHCINNSIISNIIRGYSGLFVLVLGMTELTFGLFIGLMIYRSSTRQQKDPTAWKIGVNFSLRLLMLSSLHFTTIIVRSSGMHQYPSQVAYELLTSMHALAAFLAFATQKTILQAWRMRRRTGPDLQFELADESFQASAPDKVPEQQWPEQFSQALSKHDSTRGYFQPWLHVGEVPQLNNASRV